MKYRRKASELEGFVFGVDPDVPQWFLELNPTGVDPERMGVNYHTPHGNRYAEKGDLIVKSGDRVWTIEKDQIGELYEVMS